MHQEAHGTDDAGSTRTLRERPWMIAVVIALSAVALYVLSPVLPWLVLAAWIAGLANGWMERLRNLLGGRLRAAAVLTTLLLIGLLAPIVILTVVLALDLDSLTRDLLHSQGATSGLRLLVDSGSDTSTTSEAITAFVRAHREQAFSFGGAVLTKAAGAALGLLVLVTAVYFFLADGKRIYAWWLDRAPLDRPDLHRLAHAFMETGRGLFLGVGVSGLYQAVVSTIAFVALGVPRAAALGLATFIASLVPSIGSALVWVPVAVGLWLTGHTTKAIILTVTCLITISGLDHILRPWLMRRARLQLHMLAVVVSVIGGVVVLGPWGVALGPLAVRLGAEALAIARERGVFTPSAPPPPRAPGG